MARPLPSAMRSVVVTTPGGPEALAIVERPLPEPGPGEVLVRVAATGINRVDTFQRMGKYALPPGASDILGLEFAGDVVALGSDVHRWRVGDTVCALVAGGGHAEYCAVHEDHCLPIPQGLSLIEAASLPETCFTAWTNVFDRCRLKPGETLLVHGGSSGIGVAAIQMAHHMGSNVIVTAGSDEKCAACRELGADLAVNYRTQDFVAEAKTFTKGRGVDVVLDMVGGSYVARNIDAMALDGRLAFIAFLGGSRAEVDFRHVMAKRLTITGSTLRPQTQAQKSAIRIALENHIWPLLEARQMRPVVHKTFPLAEIAQSHRLLESSAHIGKIVLTL